MDELSPRAKALLAQVRDGHEPPAGMSARVWQAVASDVATGAGVDGARAHVQQGVATGKSLLFASRVLRWLAVVAISMGVAGLVLLAARTMAPQTGPSARDKAMVRSDVSPVDTPAVREAAISSPESAQERQLAARERPAQLAKRPEDALLREVKALRKASDMIARGRALAALALLRAQEQRFANGMLQEEREALVLLARCTLDTAAAAPTARSFVEGAPTAVLRVRVERACKLKPEAP